MAIKIDKKVRPVLLAGGSGNRLWPISKPDHPKQFLKLFDKKYSLFQKTLLRLQSNSNITFLRPIILTSKAYQSTVKEQLQELHVEPLAIILEPSSKNTAPSILAALFHLNVADCNNLLFLPTDHYIENDNHLKNSISDALNFGLGQDIFTFAVEPDRPETDFGYMKVNSLEKNNIMQVLKFTEKPSLNDAKKMLKESCYFWNSGIFLASKKVFLKSFEIAAPFLIEPVRKASENAKVVGNYFFLNQTYWGQCPSISIDYAVIEKVKNIMAMKLGSKWNDLGSFEAIERETDKDLNGCSVIGSVVYQECKNSFFLRDNDSVEVIGYGIEDTIVVSTKKNVLIIHKDKLSAAMPLIKEVRDKQKN